MVSKITMSLAAVLLLGCSGYRAQNVAGLEGADAGGMAAQSSRISGSFAQTSGQKAARPYMGFSTYYAARDLQKFQVNQNSIMQIADDMKTYGLAGAGYTLLNSDIGWWFAYSGSPRDPVTHKIIPSPLIPNIISMIDYVHADGLQVGLYTDTGNGDAAGCGGFPGSGGYIAQDVAQMAAWGVDMLKVDHCGGNRTTATVYNGSDYEYSFWKQAVDTSAALTGKRMILDIADWNFEDRTSGWAPALANSWRTQSDIDYRVFKQSGTQWVYDPSDASNSPISWNLILRNFTGNDVPPAAGPGHWNNPDYLLIGGFGLSAVEEQSYFNMWVIQAAPLMLATYPADMSPSAPDGARLRAMLLNPEVIAVDQDALGRQGEKVREDVPGLVVYSKALSTSGKRAVLLLNKTNSAGDITVHFGDLGLRGSQAGVRDLVNRSELGNYSSSYTARSIPPHGSVLIAITGTEAEANLQGFQSLSKVILGSPAVLLNSGVEIEAALGLDRYYWARSAGEWSRIKPTGCGGDVVFFSSPALTYANGAINLVGLGYVDSWGAGPGSVTMYHTYSYDNGRTWACYGNIGQPGIGLLDQPAIVSADGSTVDVFARGTDNAIYSTRWSSATGWSGWQNRGACIHSGLGASSRDNGVIDLAMIGCDDKIWHAWYVNDPSAMSWSQLSSASLFSNTPAGSYDSAKGEYRVFAQSLDARDVQTSGWTATAGWSSWISLGGCVKAGVSVSGGARKVVAGTACNQAATNADTDGVGSRAFTRTLN